MSFNIGCNNAENGVTVQNLLNKKRTVGHFVKGEVTLGRTSFQDGFHRLHIVFMPYSAFCFGPYGKSTYIDS